MEFGPRLSSLGTAVWWEALAQLAVNTQASSSWCPLNSLAFWHFCSPPPPGSRQAECLALESLKCLSSGPNKAQLTLLCGSTTANQGSFNELKRMLSKYFIIGKLQVQPWGTWNWSLDLVQIFTLPCSYCHTSLWVWSQADSWHWGWMELLWPSPACTFSSLCFQLSYSGGVGGGDGDWKILFEGSDAVDLWWELETFLRGWLWLLRWWTVFGRAQL